MDETRRRLLLQAMPFGLALGLTIAGPGKAAARNGGNGGGNGNGGGGGSGNGGGSSGGNGNSSGGRSSNGNSSSGKSSKSTKSTGSSTASSDISVSHADGITERIVKGRYVMIDPKGRVIVNRPLRRSDVARLRGLASEP